MMSHSNQVYDWLQSLDLSHYFPNFVENGYEDLDICCEIGDSDLEAIGVRDIHERIELLQAVRHLRQSKTPSCVSASTYLCQNDVNYCIQQQLSAAAAAANNNNNQDYQDIEECAEIAEPFYESLSPLHLYKQYYDQPESFGVGIGSDSSSSRIFSAHSNPNLWNNVTPVRKKKQQSAGLGLGLGLGESRKSVHPVSSASTKETDKRAEDEFKRSKRTCSRDQVRLDRVSTAFIFFFSTHNLDS